MQDDGVWTCEEPVYARILNLLFPGHPHRPQDGIFGYGKFYDAVEYMLGKIKVEPNRADRQRQSVLNASCTCDTGLPFLTRLPESRVGACLLPPHSGPAYRQSDW